MQDAHGSETNHHQQWTHSPAPVNDGANPETELWAFRECQEPNSLFHRVLIIDYIWSMPSDSYSAEYWHLVPCVFKQETEIPMWPAVWFCVITSFSGFTPFQRPSAIQCKPFPPLKVTYKYSPFPPDKSHSNWICFLWNNCLNGLSICFFSLSTKKRQSWSNGSLLK